MSGQLWYILIYHSSKGKEKELLDILETDEI